MLYPVPAPQASGPLVAEGKALFSSNRPLSGVVTGERVSLLLGLSFAHPPEAKVVLMLGVCLWHKGYPRLEEPSVGTPSGSRKNPPRHFMCDLKQWA